MKCWKVIRGADRISLNPELRLVWVDECSSLSLVVDQDPLAAPTFVVSFDKVAQFTLSYASQQISIRLLDDDIGDNTIEHVLADQIWPRILAHAGQLVLHAAGVSGPTGALLFVGPSGRGKSTLAASLHQRGFALLGDDAMVIFQDGTDARCSPVYRSLRLFPDSIETLFGSSVRRSDVTDYTEKDNVHLPVPDHQGSDHPIRAIFFIAPDEAQLHASVVAVGPGDACMRLVEHSFWLDPTDKALTARKLASASALAGRVPVYQLAYPRDYARLGELHAAIFSVLD